MMDFLIKSSVCLLLLLSIYQLFLEQEKMSIFNRFYLLGSLIFSLAIPFISFEIQIEAIKTVNLNAIEIFPSSSVIAEKKTNYLPISLWTIYGIITSIFAFRFCRNCYVFFRKINSNPTQKFEGATLILVEEKILPHTFLNYIFINKNDYENRKIEGELFTHELTHVRQKHTLDVLFIEILKTIFWFNPLLIFYKKAIQLNHEFLADEKVVISYNNVPFYQSLLLEKASWNSNFYLASNLNFLVTKKRLIMMTKTTSQSRALLKKLAVVPVLAGLVFISCSENVGDKTPAEAKVVEVKPGEKVEPNTLPETDIYTSVETLPEFPGGLEAFGKYVQKEFKIPEDFVGEGNVLVSFIVETDGSLSDIKVIKDLGFGTKEEALRMMSKSPKWSPGIQDGKPVRVAYNLPIRLKIT
ncbi:M56 family metallopeptidase [Flavobacterium qiangtangense]|uniref:M56 family metallopeptidase n=1 Tax=Flavobacterium qiangtangense TaxID=1442595 RepID=A0ABW1PNE2_9FLAO